MDLAHSTEANAPALRYGHLGDVALTAAGQPEDSLIATLAKGFSIHDVLAPSQVREYLHIQRHTLGDLIRQGHLTVNPNSIIRLNAQGMWVADVADPIPSEALAKRPQTFFAGTVAAARLASQPSLLESLEKEQASICKHTLWFWDLAKLLDQRPNISNVVWTELKNKLMAPDALKWSDERLRSEVQNALQEEETDWTMFNTCRDFFFPDRDIDTQGYHKFMAKLLYKLMGISIPTENRDKTLEQMEALHHEAMLKDQALALAISNFLLSFNAPKDGGAHKFFRTKALLNQWNNLEQTLIEGKLGVDVRPLLQMSKPEDLDEQHEQRDGATMPNNSLQI